MKKCKDCKNEYEPRYRNGIAAQRCDKCTTARIKGKKSVLIKCDFCGRQTYKYKSRLREKNYCNQKCYGYAQKTNKPSTCKVCKKSFYVSVSQVRERNIQCCSKKCKYKLQGQKMNEAYKKQKNKDDKQGVLPRHIYTKNMKKGEKKTVASLIKKLDKVFSLYIRKRDANGDYFTCITCNEIKLFSKADAGHYVSRGYKSLRFDERNVHAQCTKCNRFLSGNMDEYTIFMIRRYGVDVLEELNRLKYTVKQFTSQELQDMIDHYKQKLTEF